MSIANSANPLFFRSLFLFLLRTYREDRVEVFLVDNERARDEKLFKRLFAGHGRGRWENAERLSDNDHFVHNERHDLGVVVDQGDGVIGEAILQNHNSSQSLRDVGQIDANLLGPFRIEGERGTIEKLDVCMYVCVERQQEIAVAHSSTSLDFFIIIRRKLDDSTLMNPSTGVMTSVSKTSRVGPESVEDSMRT